LLLTTPKHGTAKAVALHKLGLNLTHPVAARQQLDRTPLGQHHLLHRQAAFLKSGMGIIQGRPTCVRLGQGKSVTLTALQKTLQGPLQLVQGIRFDDQDRQASRPCLTPQGGILAQGAPQTQQHISLLRFSHHLNPQITTAHRLLKMALG
jgi:hypothetical protein